ncbi:MAG: alkaline phosphatase family protein [Pseudolabrys sp.]
MSAIDKIEHVVVLILENHSFDQMLGCMKAVYPELEGINPNNLASNVDDKGTRFFQKETEERQMKFDPHHEVEHVAMQLSDHNGGFVKNFAKEYPTSSDSERQNIMGYYKLGFLPGLHELATNYTVCDHWFSSLPGPTWPNRFFALTGTAMGRVDMPGDGTSGADLSGFFAQTQDTIFDRLTKKQVNWKVYFHDIPQSWVLKQMRAPHNAAQYFYVRQFFEDARNAPEDFPQFSLIEPDYMGFNENDDHPPHDIMKAEKLIADVYNALRGNEELWQSTLLVVFYDEHGGFYDHVVPPKAAPPDDHVANYPGRHGPNKFRFEQLGIRVPAILASPWVKAGVVDTQFDHTSLLKFLTEKWNLEPLPSKRLQAANSIEIALNQAVARTTTPKQIVLSPDQLRAPDPVLEEDALDYLSDHHKALSKLSFFLPSALWEETKKFGDAALPQAYSWGARVNQTLTAGLDNIRGLCERSMARLYETSGHKFTLAEPDKVDLKHSSERNSVVRFLGTQKARAIKGLQERIDGSPESAGQFHALRSLAALTGRPFHKYDPQHARNWLRKHMANQ